MTNPNKDKGTATETAVVRFLQEMGWPHAERRALTGRLDRGDITGVIGVVFQVKYVAKPSIGTWQEEVVQQAGNDGGSVPVLVVRTKYKNVREWDTYLQLNWMMDTRNYSMFDFARVDLHTACRVLKNKGY